MSAPRHTVEDLARLLAVRASGELMVQFGDRVVRYQTIADLNLAIAAAQRDIALTEGTAQTRRFGEYGRGY
jgi:hypothetical protein